MTKEEYQDLSSIAKVEYINKALAGGLSLTKISETLNISRSTIRKSFDKINYKYNKELNQYIHQEEDTCPANEIEITLDIEEDRYPTNNIQQQKKLVDILDNHSKIMNVIKWFDTMEDTSPTNVIEVISGLQINYNKSQPVKTTVRVDTDIWNEFGNMCKNKYEQYSKVDLLSQALREFIDKYN